MIGVAFIAIAGAMVLVRIGWGGRRPLALAGWAIALAALAALTLRDGAWGLAVGTLAAMAVALVLVLWAGWRSPPRAGRPSREAPAVLLPRRWQGLVRRLAVFVLSVPVAFAAAQWLAFGVQAAGRRWGLVEADAIVLALFLQPVLWMALMSIQLTRANTLRMIPAPVAAALAGTALWALA